VHCTYDVIFINKLGTRRKIDNMVKKTFIFVIAFLALGASKAQVPMDSLPGTYAGQNWYASPPTNPWTITPDTLFVSNIDSTYCSASYAYTPHNLGSGGIFHTAYTYCNGTYPSNGYTLFFSIDSVKMVYDSIPQPPPNMYSFSERFYGIRISNKITGIKELTANKQVDIYPNPASEILTIETLQKAIIDILNMEGECIKTTIIADRKAIIDLDGLSNGVYIIKATTDRGVVVKKFIKE